MVHLINASILFRKVARMPILSSFEVCELSFHLIQFNQHIINKYEEKIVTIIGR